MISLRLPKELEELLEEISKKEEKTKTQLVKEALTFYFYYFLGYKKPRIIKIKPDIKEYSTHIDFIYELPERLQLKDMKIINNNRELKVIAMINESTMIYSRTIYPCPLLNNLTSKIKRNKLIITIKKPSRIKNIKRIQ